MKKLILFAAVTLTLIACKDNTDTEETVITTETTVDKDAPGADVTNTNSYKNYGNRHK